MYDYIQGIAKAALADEEPRLKIAIVGEPKTGKSWLACTAPSPVFVADADDRSESIKTKEGVIVKSYLDLNPDSPAAVNELENDINKFEYAKSQGKETPRTYVLDSATYWQKAIERSLIYQDSKFGRSIRVGSKTLKIGQGWDIINGSRAYLDYLIGRLSALGNIIVIFHSAPEKDKERSTKDETKYTGRTTVQPNYLSSLLSVFNEVWMVEIDFDGRYKVQVKPNNEFLASTTLLLDPSEKPDIKAMVEKHKAALKARS